jgi:hypothetical protein
MPLQTFAARLRLAVTTTLSPIGKPRRNDPASG